MAQGHPKLKQIKLGRIIQKELAVELCRKANVAFGPCGPGLGEISRFQGIFGEYQIVLEMVLSLKALARVGRRSFSIRTETIMM